MGKKKRDTADCQEVKGVTWDFDGRQLDIKNCLALCSIHGWHKEELVTAVAVMTAESQRYTRAWHLNLDPADCASVLSTDRGLFQLNDVAQPGHTEDEYFDACTNVHIARKVYVARGEQFTAWAAFNSDAYLRYRDAVAAEWEKPGWKLRIPKWKVRCGS